MSERLIFLGILFEGPQKIEIGDVVDINIDEKLQQKTVSIGRSLINLGYYIKSYELDEFRGLIKNALYSQN